MRRLSEDVFIEVYHRSWWRHPAWLLPIVILAIVALVRFL